MSSTPIQTIIDANSDPSLSVYATNNQKVPTIEVANVVITNTQDYITEVFNLQANAAGANTEIQFNDGNGMAGDINFTYNETTETLSVGNTVIAGNLRTDNLLHANGLPYTFAPNYGNGNVATFIASYNGNLTANNVAFAGNLGVTGNVTATSFVGSGATLTNIPAANITGTIATATHATVADSANSIAGANVSGTVANATYAANSGNTNHANIADSANAVAAGNIIGTVNFATTASTVTTQAQPNITSTGTLSNLTTTGTLNSNTIISTNGGNTSKAAVTISTNNSNGGVGYAGLMQLTNAGGGVTNPNKYIRLDSTGNLQIINSGYTSTIFSLSDTGNVSSINKLTANYFVGDGSNLTNLPSPSISSISNGSSNVNVNNNDSIFINTNGSLTATFTSSPASTSYVTGALVLAGGLGANGNIHASGNVVANNTVYAGHLADFSSYISPSFVGKNAGAEYIQGALVNSDPSGSADWIAYPDNYPGPTDDHGWMDMGYTSSNFDPTVSGVDTFSITKANDGYIFASGVDGAGYGGNLIIATDSTGPNNDIIFAGNGFTSNSELMRLDVVNKKFYVGRTVPNGNINAIDLVVMGNVVPNANVTYNLGSPTQRFNKLYLAGQTIDLGGTLITTTSNGQVSIGNATFYSNGNIAGNSVAGQVANALQAGTVYTNAQPNITSVGTLSSLTVTGNISASNIAGTLTTAAQTNITSVGTLSSLSVNGNLIAGNITANNLGNIASINISGNSSQVLYGNGVFAAAPSGGGGSFGNSNVTTLLAALGSNAITTTGNVSVGNIIGNGQALTGLTGANVTGTVPTATTAATVTTNAQPNITSVGTLASLTVTGNTTSGNLTTGGYITAGAGNIGGSIIVGNAVQASGNITSGGNITANYFIGNGSQLTGLPATYGDSNVTTLLASLGSNAITTTSNVSAGNIITSGQLQSSSYTGGNISWSANNQTDFQGQIKVGGSGRILSPGGAASITLNNNGFSAPQANLTQALNLTGNANISGNITANYYIGNGSALTGINGANVTGTVPTATSANSAGSATVAATVTTNAQPNITSVGTLSSLSVTGNISAGNIAGTLTTAAQTNITSVGTLSSLSVTGNITANNLGNIASLNISGNSSQVLYGNGVFAAAPSGGGSGSTGGFTFSGNTVSVANTANMTFNTSGLISEGPNAGNAGNFSMAFNSNGVLTLSDASGANTNGNVGMWNMAGQLVNFSNVGVGSFSYNSNSNTQAYISTILMGGGPQVQIGVTPNTASGSQLSLTMTSNGVSLTGGSGVTPDLSISGNISSLGGGLYGTIATAAQPNITAIGTLAGLSMQGTGSVSGGNLVSANYFTGTLTTHAQPNITSVGTLASLTVTGNISAGNITATNLGNIASINTDGNASHVLYGNGSFGPLAPSTFGLISANATANIYGRYQITNTAPANVLVTLPDGNGLANGAWVEVRPYDQASGNFATFTIKTGANSAGIQGSSTNPSTITGNASVIAVWGGGYWYYSNH